MENISVQKRGQKYDDKTPTPVWALWRDSIRPKMETGEYKSSHYNDVQSDAALKPCEDIHVWAKKRFSRYHRERLI